MFVNVKFQIMSLHCRFPRSHASVRVFCFPWAGGGASFFTAWGKDITDEAELYALCLPGREYRFKDSINYTFQEVLDDIVSAIHEKFSDKPFIFYGHSMGALLAFFAARKLREMYGIQPDHMILSGTAAPHSPIRVIKRTRQMTDEELKSGIIKLGGTPPELLDNPELFEICLPCLRADFEIIEDMIYKHNEDAPPPLSCQIDFFDGEEDKDHDMKAWRQLTSGAFTVHKMPGGHFFLKDPENARKLINYMSLWCGSYGGDAV